MNPATPSKSPYYLGLESGGTKLVGTIANPQGHVLLTRSLARPHHDRAPATLANLVRLGRDLIREANVPIRAIGFGFGGLVDRARSHAYLNIHEEGWSDVDAVQVLSREFSLPAFVENDCKVAALAETHLGAGTLSGVTFYVTVGSGIGGGIVHDGRILPCGPRGEAEVGHLVMDPEGPPCPCGNRGCLEALCSGWGIGHRARFHAPRFRTQSPLANRIDSIPFADISRQVFAAYTTDPLAAECVTEFALTMGRAMSMVANLLAPRIIVLGGGVLRSHWILPLIEQYARPHIAPYLAADIQLVRSALGETAVSLGAVLLAHQNLT